MNDPLTMQLTDSAETLVYDLLEVPLELEPVDGRSDIETMDGNVSTYMTYRDKVFLQHTWAYMTEDEYRQLRAMERRQYTTFLRPLLTFTRLGFVDVPVKMEITTRQRIVSNCGTVQGVTITLRETAQNSIGI